MRISHLILTVATVVAAPAFVSLVRAEDLAGSNAISMVRKLAPVYPLDLLLKGRTGWAEVRFMVDYSGRPVMTSVSGASNAAFGHALLADIEANEFIPPRVNGKPQLTLSGQRFVFEGEAKLDPDEKRVLAELKMPLPTVVAAIDLDKPLTSIRQPSPVYPYALESDGLSGRAEIEFIVDQEGRVVFPRILSATQDDFGWAAATAVTKWHYQPPVKGGKKVDARTRVTINFDMKKGTATW